LPRKSNIEESLIETIARSNTFVAVANITYLQNLQFPDSEMSVHAKIAKKLNKPVILVIDRSLPHECKLWIERFFSGYNVIKELEFDLKDKSQWQAIKMEIGKLTMDVVDNKVLSRSDFIRIDLDPVHYYCSFRSDDIEICLEPCAGGFCVAAYNNDKTKLEPGKCTNHDGYLDSAGAMFGERKEDTWKIALEIANDLYRRIVIPDCKKNAVEFTNDLFKSD
jgi:hypothetical protein